MVDDPYPPSTELLIPGKYAQEIRKVVGSGSAISDEEASINLMFNLKKSTQKEEVGRLISEIVGLRQNCIEKAELLDDLRIYNDGNTPQLFLTPPTASDVIIELTEIVFDLKSQKKYCLAMGQYIYEWRNMKSVIYEEGLILDRMRMVADYRKKFLHHIIQATRHYNNEEEFRRHIADLNEQLTGNNLLNQRSDYNQFMRFQINYMTRIRDMLQDLYDNLELWFLASV